MKVRESQFNSVIKNLNIDIIKKNNLLLATRQVYFDLLEKLRLLNLKDQEQLLVNIDYYLCFVSTSNLLDLNGTKEDIIYQLKIILFGYLRDNFYLLNNNFDLNNLSLEERECYKTLITAKILGLSKREINSNIGIRNNLLNIIRGLKVQIKTLSLKKGLKNE